jgi:hypothetical protein
MNTVIAAGNSRGRVSVVGLETTERAGRLKPVSIVRFAEQVPADAGPSGARDVVLRACGMILDDPENLDRDHPRVVVSSTAYGSALYEWLYDDHRLRRVLPLIPRRPLGISTYAASMDPRVEKVSPNRLAGRLHTDWKTERLEFADGFPKLRAQMGAFVPVETKTGSLAFGNEDMSDYDDMTFALMLAAIASGNRSFGEMRYEDQTGDVWLSKGFAVARRGGSEGMRLPSDRP